RRVAEDAAGGRAASHETARHVPACQLGTSARRDPRWARGDPDTRRRLAATRPTTRAPPAATPPGLPASSRAALPRDEPIPPARRRLAAATRSVTTEPARPRIPGTSGEAVGTLPIPEGGARADTHRNRSAPASDTSSPAPSLDRRTAGQEGAS